VILFIILLLYTVFGAKQSLKSHKRRHDRGSYTHTHTHVLMRNTCRETGVRTCVCVCGFKKRTGRFKEVVVVAGALNDYKNYKTPRDGPTPITMRARAFGLRGTSRPRLYVSAAIRSRYRIHTVPSSSSARVGRARHTLYTHFPRTRTPYKRYGANYYNPYIYYIVMGTCAARVCVCVCFFYRGFFRFRPLFTDFGSIP